MNHDMRLITLVLIVHFVGDFVVQTDWQAKNKSTRWDALLKHITTYGLTLCLLWPLLGPVYIVLQTGLHCVVDAFTSRLNKWLFEKRGSHDFFVGVGLDQLIHTLCLLWLLP